MDHVACEEEKRQLISKQTLVLFGNCLAVIGIAFVIYRFREAGFSHQLENLNGGQLWVLMLSVVTYALANVSLVLGWRNIVLHFRGHLSVRSGFEIFGTSQLAKYVPGNIAHFASRQLLGRGLGLNAKLLVKSALYELALQLLVAALFGVFLTHYLGYALSSDTSVILFAALFVALALFATRFFSVSLAYACGHYLFFFVVSGGIFIGLMMNFDLLNAVNHTNNLFFVSTFVIAWLAGVATPGAPAGVGVRESVLILLLAGYASESAIIFAALLMRLVTVGGDLLFYVLAATSKTLRRYPESN